MANLCENVEFKFAPCADRDVSLSLNIDGTSNHTLCFWIVEFIFEGKEYDIRPDFSPWASVQHGLARGQRFLNGEIGEWRCFGMTNTLDFHAISNDESRCLLSLKVALPGTPDCEFVSDEKILFKDVLVPISIPKLLIESIERIYCRKYPDE